MPQKNGKSSTRASSGAPGQMLTRTDIRRYNMPQCNILKISCFMAATGGLAHLGDVTCDILLKLGMKSETTYWRKYA